MVVLLLCHSYNCVGWVLEGSQCLFLDGGIQDEALVMGRTEGKRRFGRFSRRHASLFRTGSTQENIGLETAVGTGDDMQSHATGCSSEWPLKCSDLLSWEKRRADWQTTASTAVRFRRDPVSGAREVGRNLGMMTTPRRADQGS